jgi:hypothetical protein
MHITTSHTVCLLTACILFAGGCKKTEQPVKMGQIQEPEPVCEPIRVFSAPVNETYIVMLRSAENQSGSVQTMSKVSDAASRIFSRHAPGISVLPC